MISVQKTKLLVQPALHSEVTDTHLIVKAEIEQVHDFIYFCICTSNRANEDEEISCHIPKANSAFGCIWKKGLE